METPKGYKVEIPKTNILDITAKETIENIIRGKKYTNVQPFSLSGNIISDTKEELLISLTNSNKLFIVIQYKSFNYQIDLRHTPKKKNWDTKKYNLEHTDPYYFCIERLIRYIKSEFDIGYKKNYKAKLTKIISTIESWISARGLNKVSEIFFDLDNDNNNVPKYNEFVSAFEFYIKNKKTKYEAQILGSSIIFMTKDKNYRMDTYQGQCAEIKSYIKNNSYDEIALMTEEWIWSEVYIDAGIEKHEFMPVLLKKWEQYWDEKYEEIQKEIGKTSHLDEFKDKSWRIILAFSEAYENCGNIIELANNFDEETLYPLAILSMLDIFNLECCLDEYCELTFYHGNEWESIDSADYSESEEIFYIKEDEY